MRNSVIGPINKSWKLDTLGNVVEIHDKKRIPLSEDQRNGIKGDYPYCGANGIIDYINKYIFNGEYILLAEDGGHWGRFESSAYIMVGKFWVNNHAHILLAKKGKANNHFLKHMLNYLELSPYISGSTRGKLNQKELRSIKLPIPPLVEQRGVVKVLGCVDECIRLTDEVIGAAEELKRGLMQRLLTQGIGHTEYKQTPLGKIPKTWKISDLDELVSIIDCKHYTPVYTEKGIPIIRTNDIRPEYLTFKNVNYVSTESYRDLTSRHIPKEGDIVYSREGTFGVASLATKDEPFCIGQRVVILHPKKADPKFLFFELNSPIVYNQVLRRSLGTTARRINVEDIRSLKIITPPIEEQTKIASVLQVKEKKLIEEKEKTTNLKILKQGLMQLLLSGKVRVELRKDGLHRVGDSRETHN